LSRAKNINIKREYSKDTPVMAANYWEYIIILRSRERCFVW